MSAKISTPITRTKQTRHSPSEWRALIQAFSHSNATRAQFCAAHGLALSTFDRWYHHLRQETPACVPTPASSAEANALFVELAEEEKPITAVASAWDVELDLGRGVCLRLRHAAC